MAASNAAWGLIGGIHEGNPRCRRSSAVVVLAAPAVARGQGAPAPIDPQNWSWQDELTWNDYKPLPGPDYSDPAIQPTVKKWKVALVVTDFPGTPYSVTLPQGSTVFGTPTAEAHDVPRANVANFLKDFYNTPQALNHFQTMNRYWMEDSFGKYGVQLDAFGPYQLPGRQYQYFLNDQALEQRALPDAATTPCNRNFRTDARAAWVGTGPGQVSTAEAATYDNVFYVSAGEDESSTWQEFGEMKWMTPEEVTGPVRPRPVRRHAADQLGRDALRAVDLVGLGGHQLAERLGQHVGRGRVLGHVDLRPRAVAQPRRSPTTTATRTRRSSSAGSPACGT